MTHFFFTAFSQKETVSLPHRASVPRQAGTLLLAAVLALSGAQAAEYFVRPGGNDAGEGVDLSGAFATIQRGIDALEAGDTLTIEPGEYVGTATRENLGSSEKETRIRARLPGTVLLRGDVPAPRFVPLEVGSSTARVKVEGMVEAVNEVDSLKTLSSVASPDEVAFSPGSFHFDAGTGWLTISSTDLRPVDSHFYTLSVASGHGLWLKNPRRVTVEGLTFRGFNSLEPLKDSGPQYVVWGLYLDRASDCVIRDCQAYLSGGGILVRSGEEKGGNLIEDCEAYASMAPHSAEMGAISVFGPNNDNIRRSKGYLSEGAGIRLYGSPFRGTNSHEECLVWGTTGRGLDIKGAESATRGFIRNSVGLGQVNGSNISHSLIGKRNIYVPDAELSGDNVLLAKEGINSRREFADPLNFDFRLQSTSSLRGAAPDGGDRGPFPFKANVYYVRAGGDDQADGLSIKTAWRSPTRALRDLKPGDTVYFGRGIYEAPFEIAAGKAGAAPISFRARGDAPVVFSGPVQLKNSHGLHFERLRFASTVEAAAGSDLSFLNCRFAGPEQGLLLASVSGARVDHCEFLRSENAGLVLTNSSQVMVTNSAFDNSGTKAVGILLEEPATEDGGEAELSLGFSDRNAFAVSERAWMRNGRLLSLGKMPGGREAHSFAATMEIEENKGFPIIGNRAAFGGRGRDGRGVGFHQDLLRNELFMSQPRLHSVSATTANIEWQVSRGADCVVAWGKTPDCSNEETYTINTFEDRFRSFSLTGLEPGTTYYFRVKSVQLLKYPDYGEAEVVDPHYEVLSFTTAQKDAPPRVYFVAPDGDDAASGLSRKEAWRTVAHAAAEVLPGDTVKIAAGSYPEQVRVRATGEKGKPIRFESLPGERVVFDGIKRRLQNAWTICGKSHIEVDGFYFYNHRGSPGGNVSIRLFNVVASRDILIRRCLMDGRGGGAYPGSFLTGWSTRNLTISNCVSILAPDGVEVSECPDFRLENSVFILTMICNVKLGSPAILTSNIFCDSGKFKSEQNVQLMQYGDIRAIADRNNCYYFRLPTEERTAFFVQTIPRDWDKPWERITLPELKLRAKETDSIVANPEFAVLASLPEKERKPFAIDALYSGFPNLDFADLFSTNPELIKRGIGLQPDAFAGFASPARSPDPVE